jgi:hypothetical protein
VRRGFKSGDIDPTMVITYRMALSDAAGGYAIFLNKEEHREKGVGLAVGKA